jgi:hypothetical protein
MRKKVRMALNGSMGGFPNITGGDACATGMSVPPDPNSNNFR